MVTFRQILKNTFAMFLAFSKSDFAYFLKKHGGLYDWKSKRKIPDKSKKTVKNNTRNHNWTLVGGREYAFAKSHGSYLFTVFCEKESPQGL